LAPVAVLDGGGSAWRCVIGSLAGSALSPHVPPERLRKAFAVFVAVMAAFVLVRQLIALLFHET
jgi:uncharacterized membrane protein YfcA